jgi:hypothetical protein
MKNMITEGQDSFLDIVANLVGILIILVVLVGAHASQRTVENRPEVDQRLQEQLADVAKAVDKQSDQARKLHIDNRQLEQQIVEENQLAAALSDRRHQMMVQLELVKHAVADKNQQLDAQLAKFDEAEQEKLKREIELAAAEQELNEKLEQINSQTIALAASFQPIQDKTLTHYPNPIAKTVFSKEIHFRLADGKLSWVPLDNLIAAMKAQWRVKAEALETADRTTETVGPIGGFRLQYQLAASDIGPPGQRRGRSVRFDNFRVIPQPGLAGETIDKALAQGSAFRRALSEFEPGQTTVSIWLYPNGFDDHRKIKIWLHENGFQMASWPLQYGRHISGGPKGFKTSAQ